MLDCRFWDRTWNPFRESKFFFFQNLTYSYSFSGWNLPEITMSLESLDNYFGITVKSRKNDEKFGFVDFCLWCRNDGEIIATLWYTLVNFTTKNTMINFFFHKKKFRPTSQNGRFPILRPNLRPLSGIDNFVFSKLNLVVQFSGKIYRELPCRWNHYIIVSGSRSKVEKTMKNSVFSTFVCDHGIMLE